MAAPRATHRVLGVTHVELTMDVEAKEKRLQYLATLMRKQELGFIAVSEIEHLFLQVRAGPIALGP